MPPVPSPCPLLWTPAPCPVTCFSLAPGRFSGMISSLSQPSAANLSLPAMTGNISHCPRSSLAETAPHSLISKYHSVPHTLHVYKSAKAVPHSALTSAARDPLSQHRKRKQPSEAPAERRKRQRRERINQDMLLRVQSREHNQRGQDHRDAANRKH